MIIDWNNIKSCVLLYYNMEKKQPSKEFNAHTGSIYNHFYRNIPRSDPGHIDLSDWNSKATKFITNEQPLLEKVSLQVKREGAVFVKKAAQLAHNDSITAIYFTLEKRPKLAKARINVVVKSSSSGISLFEKMHFVSTKKCVESWKVMNPKMGSTGPDSAVIYLCEALNSANTQALIAQLNDDLSADLEEIKAFALQRLGKGLYGCDLPSEDIQLNRLKILPRDTGSAGWIISSVLSKAIVYGAREMKKIKGHQTWAADKQSKYIMEYLSIVLWKDLGWKLRCPPIIPKIK